MFRLGTSCVYHLHAERKEGKCNTREEIHYVKQEASALSSEAPLISYCQEKYFGPILSNKDKNKILFGVIHC